MCCASSESIVKISTFLGFISCWYAAAVKACAIVFKFLVGRQ